MSEENNVEDISTNESHQESEDNSTSDNTKDAKSSNDSAHNVEDIISGWNDDRSKLSEIEKENFQLKQQLASTTSKKDDEDEELSMDERVVKEIERRKSEETELEAINKKSAEREVAYMERVNPSFKANKEKILQIAVDAKVNLSEAVEIFKARKTEAKEEIKKAKANKKKSKATVVSKKDKYNVDEDGELSISDIFRAEL